MTTTYCNHENEETTDFEWYCPDCGEYEAYEEEYEDFYGPEEEEF